jgi:Tat protein translocase TatB subunit
VYLFIFESLGTSELILIGIIALIFLGPRKLPSIAKTIGKTLADLRNTTNEFKSTWEREVDFETEEKAWRTGDADDADATVPRAEPQVSEPGGLALPEIKPVDKDQFEQYREEEAEPIFVTAETTSENGPSRDLETPLSDKKSWL